MGIQMFMKIVSILQAFFQPCQALDLSISEPVFRFLYAYKKKHGSRNPQIKRIVTNVMHILI